MQRWTPTIEAIYVPDIDTSLDEQSAKRAFWAAFRAVGDWYQAQPPTDLIPHRGAADG